MSNYEEVRRNLQRNSGCADKAELIGAVGFAILVALIELAVELEVWLWFE